MKAVHYLMVSLPFVLIVHIAECDEQINVRKATESDSLLILLSKVYMFT